jgi:hypothetical protein
MKIPFYVTFANHNAGPPEPAIQRALGKFRSALRSQPGEVKQRPTDHRPSQKTKAHLHGQGALLRISDTCSTASSVLQTSASCGLAPGS